MSNEQVVPESTPENEEELASSAESATVESEDTEALEASAEESETPEEAPDSDFIPNEEMSEKVRKRINRLTWEKLQLKREYEAKLAEAQKASVSTPEPAAAGKPTLRDFNYETEPYTEALAAWKSEQIINERLKALENQAAQQQAQQSVSDFQSRQLKYAQDHSEYSQLVSERSIAIDSNSPIEKYILNSHVGPELHHRLLDDIATLEKIKALPEYLQGAELARLEDSLKTPRKQKTRAPEPVKSIETGKVSSGFQSPLSRLKF